MKFLMWIFGVVCGALIFWGLLFVPDVKSFNDKTHGWEQPTQAQITQEQIHLRDNTSP